MTWNKWYFLLKRLCKKPQSNCKKSITHKQIPFRSNSAGCPIFLHSNSVSILLLTLSRYKMNLILSLPGIKTSISPFCRQDKLVGMVLNLTPHPPPSSGWCPAPPVPSHSGHCWSFCVLVSSVYFVHEIPCVFNIFPHLLPGKFLPILKESQLFSPTLRTTPASLCRIRSSSSSETPQDTAQTLFYLYYNSLPVVLCLFSCLYPVQFELLWWGHVPLSFLYPTSGHTVGILYVLIQRMGDCVLEQKESCGVGAISRV